MRTPEPHVVEIKLSWMVLFMLTLCLASPTRAVGAQATATCSAPVSGTLTIPQTTTVVQTTTINATSTYLVTTTTTHTSRSATVILTLTNTTTTTSGSSTSTRLPLILKVILSGLSSASKMGEKDMRADSTEELVSASVVSRAREGLSGA